MSVFVLDHVSKSFKVEKTVNNVLKDINVIFPDNGLVSIVGKSGSGKSTLLNILMGIEKPTSGKVLFCGKDISKFSDRKFSNYHLNGASLIFQHYNLFNDFTAFENVMIPLYMKGVKRSESKRIVNELFKQFNIENLRDRKVQKLSGGEKQRIAILRGLVTNPKVLLCDEPTGALDSKNSHEIMGILKKISKKTLVIMVSHNKQLVYRFSDQILSLRDGTIKENISSIKNTFTVKHKKEKNSYSSKWSGKFLRHNLAKNFKKNLFSILACSVSFAAMFLSVGFSEGSKSSQEEALVRNLSIGYATVSRIEYIDLEGSPLSFQKTTRPDLYQVDNYLGELQSVRCEENFSYLISNYPSCTFKNQTVTNFQMVPVYDSTLANYGKELLVAGTPGDDSFESILVNEEFANLFDESILKKEIVLSSVSNINYSTSDPNNPFIKDTLNIEKRFKIVGILREFSFLNTPKIYFSYKGAKQFLKASSMENLSKYLRKNYSFYDYVVNCKNDDPISSYSSYLFLENLSERNEFFSKVKDSQDNDIQISSTVFDIKETYTTFINSFSTTLILFVIIAFFGINFILGMISLSTFIENKKNTAIMTCLGARNTSIYSLYLKENYCVVLSSFVLSIFSAIFLEKILNPIIFKKFSLSNLISIPFKSYFGVSFALPIFICFIAIVFSTIFTIVPMLFYRHISIADELRDE